MLLKDHVCGMEIHPNQGQTYYFCSADCKRAFNKNPAGFPSSMKGYVRGKSA